MIRINYEELKTFREKYFDHFFNIYATQMNQSPEVDPGTPPFSKLNPLSLG